MVEPLGSWARAPCGEACQAEGIRKEKSQTHRESFDSAG